MSLFFRHSGLWHPERAVLQVRVEREAAGTNQGHSASRLAHVYNPRLLWPVQYPLSNIKSVYSCVLCVLILHDPLIAMCF